MLLASAVCPFFEQSQLAQAWRVAKQFQMSLYAELREVRWLDEQAQSFESDIEEKNASTRSRHFGDVTHFKVRSYSLMPHCENIQA